MSASPSQVPAPALRAGDVIIALCTGGLLTFMVLLNGAMASYTTPFFSSLAAHGAGTVAAALALGVVWLIGRKRHAATAHAPAAKPRAPLWAYLGGLSGAVTVMLTSATANSPLALTGTLALGLAGQVIFSLICDRFGLFGMVKRAPRGKDLIALALIVAGALLIIFAGASQ